MRDDGSWSTARWSPDLRVWIFGDPMADWDAERLERGRPPGETPMPDWDAPNVRARPSRGVRAAATPTTPRASAKAKTAPQAPVPGASSSSSDSRRPSRQRSRSSRPRRQREHQHGIPYTPGSSSTAPGISSLQQPGLQQHPQQHQESAAAEAAQQLQQWREFQEELEQFLRRARMEGRIPPSPV